MKILFVRTAPLNVTPAVERYVSFLRDNNFDGEIVGVELDFQPDRPSLKFLNKVYGLKVSFITFKQRVIALIRWQLFLFRIIFSERPDVLQFCDVYSAIPALFAKLLLKTNLIFDIRDPIYPSLRSKSLVMAKLLGWIESFTALMSDAVVLVSSPLIKFIPSSIKNAAYIIPNLPIEDNFNDFLFNPDDTIVVTLAGFISHRRNLETWLAVTKLDKMVTLDIYGSIFDEETKNILLANGVEKIDRLNQTSAFQKTERADAVSLMYDPSIEINCFAAPNKYYEALMLGKPIICAQGMLIGEEIQKTDCGLVIPYGNVDALLTAIKLLRKRTERIRLGKNSRGLYEKKYSRLSNTNMWEMYSKLNIIRP